MANKECANVKYVGDITGVRVGHDNECVTVGKFKTITPSDNSKQIVIPPANKYLSDNEIICKEDVKVKSKPIIPDRNAIVNVSIERNNQNILCGGQQSIVYNSNHNTEHNLYINVTHSTTIGDCEFNLVFSESINSIGSIQKPPSVTINENVTYLHFTVPNDIVGGSLISSESAHIRIKFNIDGFENANYLMLNVYFTTTCVL